MPRYRPLALLCLAALFLVSCRGRKVEPPDYTIAVVPRGGGSAFWKSVRAGALKAGQELNVAIQWVDPGIGENRRSQSKILSELVATNIQGIVLDPNMLFHYFLLYAE